MRISTGSNLETECFRLREKHNQMLRGSTDHGALLVSTSSLRQECHVHEEK